jgi:hypothetical protein
MQHSLSLRARGAGLAAIVVALNACDDHSNLNSPSPQSRLQDVQAQIDMSPSFIFSDVRLSGTMRVIDGPRGDGKCADDRAVVVRADAAGDR